MSADMQGRKPARRAESERFGPVGFLTVVTAICIGLASWAIVIYIGKLAGWW